jgi:hypothetical protein
MGMLHIAILIDWTHLVSNGSIWAAFPTFEPEEERRYRLCKVRSVIRLVPKVVKSGRRKTPNLLLSALHFPPHYALSVLFQSHAYKNRPMLPGNYGNFSLKSVIIFCVKPPSVLVQRSR